jgi:hypothetical protein
MMTGEAQWKIFRAGHVHFYSFTLHKQQTASMAKKISCYGTPATIWISDNFLGRAHTTRFKEA